MTQKIDPAKLKAAAERLEWVCQQYPNEESVQHVLKVMQPMIDDAKAVIEHVAEVYADYPQDRLDGLTVDAGSWWFNLRPSNTEPLLRLNLEAPNDDECAARVAEVRGHFSAASDDGSENGGH